MSKNKGGANKHNTKTVITESTSKKLALLAEKLSNNRGSDRDKENIVSLIYKCLKDGQDDILFESLEKTKTPEGYDELDFLITDCSETKLVDLTTNELGEILLFAVPIVMCVGTNMDFPDKLKDVSVCKLFRKHGLISQNPSLFLNNEFLHLSDVDLPPSKKFKMLIDAMKIQVGVENTPISLRQSKNKEKTNQQEPALILRYLVGTITSGFDESPFFPDDDNLEDYRNSMEKWREAMQNELIKQTGLEDIVVGDPDSFTDAVFQGINAYQKISLSIKTKVAVAKTAKTQNLCHAAICIHQDENEDQTEIRISFLDTHNQFVDGFAWTLLPHDDLVDLCEFCCSTIRELGVDSFVFSDEFMPLTYCESTGKPDFLIPQIERNSIINHSSALH